MCWDYPGKFWARWAAVVHIHAEYVDLCRVEWICLFVGEKATLKYHYKRTNKCAFELKGLSYYSALSVTFEISGQWFKIGLKDPIKYTRHCTEYAWYKITTNSNSLRLVTLKVKKKRIN